MGYRAEGASESQDTVKKAAAGAALGTLICAVADGGKGAAWGAAIGAGTAASAAKPAVVAPQSLVKFRLEQGSRFPLAVRVTETAADGP